MTEATRVLIVDDDAKFADSLKDVLDAEGYDSQVANTGKEAIDVIKKTSFDIVLMDIKMPVMDGVEIFKRIKKINPDIVVIMMTAFSVENLIKDALKEGAFGILYKPLDIKKLVEMIEMAKTGGGLIMIADDDPDIRQTLKDVFEEKGYFIALANNSWEAVRIAGEKPTAIIFLDMKFPPLNGLETYLEIRKVNSGAVVVLMTAYRREMGDLIAEALEKSAYACLYKPFDPRKAVDMVKEIIQRKKK